MTRGLIGTEQRQKEVRLVGAAWVRIIERRELEPSIADAAGWHGRVPEWLLVPFRKRSVWLIGIVERNGEELDIHLRLEAATIVDTDVHECGARLADGVVRPPGR